MENLKADILYFYYNIKILYEDNGVTYTFKIGINDNFDYGYAPSVENGIDLAKEFIGTIMRFSK